MNTVNDIMSLIDNHEREKEIKPDKVLVSVEVYKELINFCRDHYMTGDDLVLSGVPIVCDPTVSGFKLKRENSIRFMID